MTTTERHRAYITNPHLPREVTPGLHWLGGCSDSAGWPGREHLPSVHEPISVYLFVGSERTVLIDPGHAALWYSLEGQIETALAGRPLDYIFPTHPEIPHSGNLGRLCREYPDAKVIGDTRDYWLFYPEIDRSRYVPLAHGESVSLGDSDFVALEPIWRDLTASMWGYETGGRILFPADGLGVLHPHSLDACGLLPDELPGVDQADPGWLALRGPFHWMEFRDPKPGCAAFRSLLEAYPVSTVCSAHGAPITDDAADFMRRVVDTMEAGARGGSLAAGNPAQPTPTGRT